MSEQLPSVGRIVHYTAYNGVCLAAIVTRVMENSPSQQVHLCVLTSLDNVQGNPSGGVQFHFHVPSSDTPTPGYWHWPERV